MLLISNIRMCNKFPSSKHLTTAIETRNRSITTSYTLGMYCRRCKNIVEHVLNDYMDKTSEIE